MNKQEATNIKDEILRKEGSIYICNTITIDGVVLIKDILDIIDKHVEETGMTFKVIDTKTGKEPTRRVVQNIKNKVVERTMDIDQFFVGEDGALALLDEYGRIISVDMERFEVVAESEE